MILLVETYHQSICIHHIRRNYSFKFEVIYIFFSQSTSMIDVCGYLCSLELEGERSGDLLRTLIRLREILGRREQESRETGTEE